MRIAAEHGISRRAPGTLAVCRGVLPVLLLVLMGCDAMLSAGKKTAVTTQPASPSSTSNLTVDGPVIVDFATPAQAGWFRVIGPDANETSPPQVGPIPTTDDYGLAVMLPTPEHALVLDVRQLNQPSPPGDWRKFAALTMSVFVPDTDCVFSLVVSTGQPPIPHGIQQLHAEPGWNQLRIDLD
ncbi:MAG: hypothetical protein ABIG44_02665, partial [Planctomycetota bacterium]